MDCNQDSDDNDDDFIGPPLPPGFNLNQNEDNGTSDNGQMMKKDDSDDDDSEYQNDLDGIYKFILLD